VKNEDLTPKHTKHILTPYHNLQAVSPIENLIAMYDEAWSYGRF